MTDKDIIKALECCANATHKDCKNCPLFVVDGCVKTMSTNALDLIKRQQAEIEQWKEEANKYQTLWCIVIDDIETSQSEAIKEFADRLKEEINIRPTHSNEQNKYVCFLIDNLVKEMVGEK